MKATIDAPAAQEFIADVVIPVGDADLHGEADVPSNAPGLVLFADGGGSAQHRPISQAVARVIRDAGIGTLLFDLLTAEEERQYCITRRLPLDINLLAQRLISAAHWVEAQPKPQPLDLGFFGSNAGGAAALIAAAELGDSCGAVVSRGDRPDLAMATLSQVGAPTLLIVGKNNDLALQLNEEAFARLHCKKKMEIIPGATHFFEERGALEQVARLASNWFSCHLRKKVEAT